MYTEYDENDDFTDVYFNNDLCMYCIHADYCPLIKAVQVDMVTLNNTQSLEYCEMFTGRSFWNKLKVAFGKFRKAA